MGWRWLGGGSVGGKGEKIGPPRSGLDTLGAKRMKDPVHSLERGSIDLMLTKHILYQPENCVIRALSPLYLDLSL